MRFCIRDDDTSFFTAPDELEQAYGEIVKHGPVSLAIIPFCCAGKSRGLPTAYRERWSIHPLEENKPLVEYLRKGIADGRYEPMLHGYHHDDPDGHFEFVDGTDLRRKVREGKKYLETLLGSKIRVFVPPHNAIGKTGLDAVDREGLHLGGVAGMRGGWSCFNASSLKAWWRIRRWRTSGHDGIPWVVELGKHRELAGNPVTPLSNVEQSLKRFDEACEVSGVFCAATHYWELAVASRHSEKTTVGDHLRALVNRAKSDPRVVWLSVGDVLEAETSPSGISGCHSSCSDRDWE
jgi:hypothetical protein